MKNEFKKLKIKMLYQTLLIMSIALIIGIIIKYIFIDGFFQAPFADTFIDICETIFGLSYYESLYIYEFLFRSKKQYLLLIGLFLLILILLFYYTIKKFTAYFKEISKGVDKLVDESSDKIQLSPELDFMENKLNTVRNSLIKRAKDAKEAEQRKNDLVVYLAHDIKTPLTSVIGYLNLLDEEQNMPQTQKSEYVKTTLNNALRLELLINEFFDITRFNLQTIQLNISDINLIFMLYQLSDEFYPILTPEGKKIIINSQNEIVISGDADKLARVFRNILKNAYSFSYKNTDIIIDVKKNEDNVIITFTNNGDPIPNTKLDSIFEKFYRLDYSRSSKTGGAGLGLAIAKEIVNAHKGSIYAESSGSETVFTVILPSFITNS